MSEKKISIIGKANLGRVIRQLAVEDFDTLSKIVCKKRYSLSLFAGERRRNQDFSKAHFVALDIDDGLTLETAIKILQSLDLKSFVATTKSNQRPKNGKVADRYRIVLELESCIDSREIYRKTMNYLLFVFPEADRACIDPARYFEPSFSVEFINTEGNPVRESSFDIKLAKSKPSLFVEAGAQAGEWHTNSTSLLGMLRKAGVPQDFASKVMTSIAIRHGNGKGLESGDESLIDDIYNRYEQGDPQTCSSPGLIPDDSSQLSSVLRQRIERRSSLAESLPFIDPIFDQLGLKIIRGLTLVGNESGKGKTTAVVNIAARILSATDKKVLILAGEVPSEEYYCAIASVLVGVDYYQYRESNCSPLEAKKVESKVTELIPKLKILDHSLVENLHSPSAALSLLNEAKNNGFGIAIIDYYQIFNQGKGNQIEITKKFGNDLNRFCSESSMPVVLMAQLRGVSKEFNEPFNERIQQDKHIFNHCQLAIEMVTDLKRNHSQFVIRKTRYSKYLDRNIVLKFDGGKLSFDEKASIELENEVL